MSSFHGCMRKNKDGSNRITEKGKLCLLPTSSQFWKKVEDVPFQISMRSQDIRKGLLKRADLINIADREDAETSEYGSRQMNRTFTF